MQVAKPLLSEAPTAAMGSSVLAVPERCYGALLRMQGHPTTYGYVTYVDPYLDYVTLELVVVDGAAAVATWSGTHRALAYTWEPFLLEGAA